LEKHRSTTTKIIKLKTATEAEQPIILNTTSSPKINTAKKQKTRKPIQKNNNETLYH